MKLSTHKLEKVSNGYVRIFNYAPIEWKERMLGVLEKENPKLYAHLKSIIPCGRCGEPSGRMRVGAKNIPLCDACWKEFLKRGGVMSGFVK